VMIAWWDCSPQTSSSLPTTTEAAWLPTASSDQGMKVAAARWCHFFSQVPGEMHQAKCIMCLARRAVSLAVPATLAGVEKHKGRSSLR
jgi:hypothetical protein